MPATRRGRSGPCLGRAVAADATLATRSTDHPAADRPPVLHRRRSGGRNRLVGRRDSAPRTTQGAKPSDRMTRDEGTENSSYVGERIRSTGGPTRAARSASTGGDERTSGSKRPCESPYRPSPNPSGVPFQQSGRSSSGTLLSQEMWSRRPGPRWAGTYVGDGSVGRRSAGQLRLSYVPVEPPSVLERLRSVTGLFDACHRQSRAISSVQSPDALAAAGGQRSRTGGAVRPVPVEYNYLLFIFWRAVVPRSEYMNPIPLYHSAAGRCTAVPVLLAVDAPENPAVRP